VRLADGSQIIDKYEAAHVAAVADPAYGMQKAQIKGKCSGDSETCETNLARVEASRESKKAVVTPSKCGKFLRVEQGSKVFVIAKASDCVESCIQEKANANVEIDDQVIANCMSDCGEKKAKNAETCDDPDVNCDPLASPIQDANSSLNDKPDDKKVTMTKAEEDKKLDEAEEEEDKTDATKAQEEEDHNQGEEQDKEEAEDEEDKKDAEEEDKEDAEEDDKCLNEERISSN
jgi:hypothetical protein